jgi:hypothetical protein
MTFSDGIASAMTLLRRALMPPIRLPPRLIDLGNGDAGQLGISCFFLVQDFREQLVSLRLAEGFGPFAQRPISRDFVVLDGLAAADDRGVFGHGTFRFLDDTLSLFDQTFDGIALLA